MNQTFIRNFAIIAHIDHGKSTLADRFLEITKTIKPENLHGQMLDKMDLERERGITIKLTPVRMNYTLQPKASPRIAENARPQRLSDSDGGQANRYILNLVDTPGHVDFTYEVSRALAAVEGVVLLVDATKGVQAQTIANLKLARELNLVVIPAINKIDLAAARIEEIEEEIVNILGVNKSEILYLSAKSGQGVEELIQTIIEKIPPPKGERSGVLRALVFDSVYDKYRGVVVHARIIDGKIEQNEKIFFINSSQNTQVLELGFFNPEYEKKSSLQAGDVGYLVTDLRNISSIPVGDTITNLVEIESRQVSPLPGYKKVKPTVFASFFPTNGEASPALADSLKKLQLNDSAIDFIPVNSNVLGQGFRVGCLGMLHLEIIKERLKREFNLDLIITTPQVDFRVENNQYFEPYVNLEIVTPGEFVGAVMTMVPNYRAIYKNIRYLGKLAILEFECPLSEIIVDFYDQLKSKTSGFATMNYEYLEERPADLQQVSVSINNEKIEALDRLEHISKSKNVAHLLAKKLKENLPRQLFETRIQVEVNHSIVASQRIPPLRKDVTAKLYGGDVTRKRKLLEKQKKGKKKMFGIGKISIPPEVFYKLLK